MTLCTGTPAERSLERYIQGTLPELEARSFEEHYFDCPVCLAQVEALQAVTMHLTRHPVAQPATPKPRLVAWPIPARLGAIAALLLLGFLSLHMLRRPPQPTASFAPAPPAAVPAPPPPTSANLADLSLPPFQPSHLRGQGSDQHFIAGMQSYATHDCPRAIQSLAQVAPHSDEAASAHLYLAACQINVGSLDEASVILRKLAATDTPQQEAALFSLAQLSLLRNDTPSARHNLARTISLHGDFEARARTQLEKLR